MVEEITINYILHLGIYKFQLIYSNNRQDRLK